MPRSSPRILSLRLYYVTACGVGGIYLPFFPRWLEARGMLGLRLGVIAAVAPAMGVLAPTAFGALADALGLRGGLLRFACAGALAAFGALTVLAASGSPLGFGTLLVSSLVFALFRSPMGLIADVVAIEAAPALGTSYGRVRLWGSLGFIAAVLPASRYLDPRSPVVFPAVTTALVFAALLAALCLPTRADLPAPGPSRGACRRLLAEEDFRIFLVAALLGQTGHVAYDLCFSMHLFDLGVPSTTVGAAWALGTACEVLMMAYSAPLFRSFSSASLFAFALGAASLRWALIACVKPPGVLLALQPLHALSFGLAWLASLAYTSQRFPARSLATAQGLFATAVGVGSVLGMILWGVAYRQAGGAFVFAGAACFSACGCAFAVALERLDRLARKPRQDVVSRAAVGE